MFKCDLEPYCNHITLFFSLPQNPSIEIRRECILKALCIYLNEDPDNLFKKFMVSLDTFDQLSLLIFKMQVLTQLSFFYVSG